MSPLAETRMRQLTFNTLLAGLFFNHFQSRYRTIADDILGIWSRVFTTCSLAFLRYSRAMSDDSKEEQIEASIAHALAELGYHPPRFRDQEEQHNYFLRIARHVRVHLEHSFDLQKKTPQKILPSD